MTTTTTFEIHAWASDNCGKIKKEDLKSADGFRAYAYFPTPDEARAFAATFPKSLGLKASHCGTSNGIVGSVSFYVELTKNGVNGGVNETGMKRIKKLLSLVNWTYADRFLNSLTEENFRAFFGL